MKHCPSELPRFLLGMLSVDGKSVSILYLPLFSMMDLVMEIQPSDLKFCYSYASWSHQWTKRNFTPSCYMKIVNQSLRKPVEMYTL